MFRRFMLATCSFIVAGCVTKSTHEEVLSQLDDTQDALVSERQTVQSLETTLAQAEARSARLADRIDALQTEVTDLEDKLATTLRDRSALEASVGEMKMALANLRQQQAETNRRIAEYRDLTQRFGSMVDAGTLEVKVVDGRIVVVLQTDILFPSGSAKLSESGEKAIRDVADVLASVPDKRFQVEGHTDAVPIHTARYPSNWELAQARALTVVKTAIDAGMPAQRLSTAAFSKFRPVSTNETDDGRQLNRRIEIVLLPDWSRLPGADELRRLNEAS